MVKAVAVLGSSDYVKGTINFSQEGDGPTTVTGTISGLKPVFMASMSMPWGTPPMAACQLDHISIMQARIMVPMNSSIVERELCGSDVIAMLLATAYDKASEAWTGLSPSTLELKRFVAYAQSRANLLMKLTFLKEIGPYRWEVEQELTQTNNFTMNRLNLLIMQKDFTNVSEGQLMAI
ncbi:uncharacterized protein LOC130727709 isoform X2 [Lotus japonicus]|uniref:uncharacterized protein LOC130727709 isoform X2 n=1 Tax=Lotus japonicus TaxID=34305 RepID=UPI00258B7622|nr:uncharacterized protein LOC130727709 isoform X2 [Lotus japonicus]